MEKLMQYIWQHRLWPKSHLTTVDGRPLQVIDPGKLNTDSGPDFFNAKIKIDGNTWVGNIEIHVKASDWHRHGHDGDKAYDSVILHVVDRDDTAIYRSDGEVIPQMVMACTPDFYQHYARLTDNADRDLPCHDILTKMPPMMLHAWLDALLFERLYDKTHRIEDWLTRFAGDWEMTAFVALSRCLGFSINGDPFERLACATPLQWLMRHSDDLFIIEAILLGQSGLIDDPNPTDDYQLRLHREYEYMRQKFGLRKPTDLAWKMSRMRPANFPHRRIAMLAQLIFTHNHLLRPMLAVSTIKEAETLLKVPFSGYWANHYSFGASSWNAGVELSQSSIVSLIINAIVPLQFAYAMAHGNKQLSDRAIDLLSQLPPERNRIIDLFRNFGLKPRSAADTQSLIQLRRIYCERHDCLRCRIGHRHLSASSPRK